MCSGISQEMETVHSILYACQTQLKPWMRQSCGKGHATMPAPKQEQSQSAHSNTFHPTYELATDDLDKYLNIMSHDGIPRGTHTSPSQCNVHSSPCQDLCTPLVVSLPSLIRQLFYQVQQLIFTSPLTCVGSFEFNMILLMFNMNTVVISQTLIQRTTSNNENL